MGWAYHNAHVVYENLTRWTAYYNNPDCVKAVFHSDYWYSVAHVKKIESVESPVAFLAVTTTLAIAGSIVLAYLYFKKWSKDADIISKKPIQS